MSNIQTAKISSFQEYTALLCPSDDNRLILYRGQAADWPLIPKIARLRSRYKNILDAEAKMLADFKREALTYLKVSPYGWSDWNWLTIGQHHGLPTRLLDWTTASLTALLFAIGDFNPQISGPCVVWRYEPNEDEEDIVDVEFGNESPFDDSYHRTKVYIPQQVHIRPKVQNGVFTIHRYSAFSKCFVPFESINQQKQKLLKIFIPRSVIPQLRAEMINAGMTFEKIFPDVDGLSKHLQWKYFKVPDEHSDEPKH